MPFRLFYPHEFFCEMEEDLSDENLSRLFRSPDLFSHLQDLKLDGGEKIVGFQWLGPHFLTILKYATRLCCLYNDDSRLVIIRDLLKLIHDSASKCVLYGESEHYKNLLEIILSFLPEIREHLTIEDIFNNKETYWRNYRLYFKMDTLKEIFIDFLLETIGELLDCRTCSSVLVSNQFEVLLKELKFLLTFLVDTVQSHKSKQNKNISIEIEAVFNESGLFSRSFIFTMDLVTVAQMDLAISVLLERIEIVRVKITDHCIAVSMKLNCGSGSLQIAESSREVSSSQNRSIPMVEEMTVGLDDMTTEIVRKLLGGPNYRQIISIVGMGGLGKTTLAKKIYNHSNVRNHFDKLSWCVVSQNYQKRKLLIDILSSVSPLNRDKISEMEDEELAGHLHRTLIGRRYLIVMDDLWDIHAWDDLKRYFPHDSINGSRVLFTSRLKNVALEISHIIIEPAPLSPGESWNLLEQKVFKKERCPQELQDIGKQIAENCHGLPLSIITVAGVLSNMEKKESLWQRVVESLSSYISQKADDYIPTLKLSYMHLPNHLKPCFLYLSAFQEDEEIRVQHLLALWIAEGFIEKKEQKCFEDVAEEYLMELINRSLLQVAERRSDNGIKVCTLHDLVLDMCNKIAVEDEIFLLQHQFLIAKHRHRLCMDRSHHLSKALSILYNSEKTRILDVMDDGIVQVGIKSMPDLRYLEIPSMLSSIGRLQNLEILIVTDALYIPTHILNMPKLRHLSVTEQYSPVYFRRTCDSSRINSLQTLCYVHIDNLEDQEILRCSPNLCTLKCRYVDNGFADLNFLTQLESLTIDYKNNFEADFSVLKFPKNIKKLSLDGMNLPWEKTSLIATLPNLEILKLEYGSFTGKIWDTKDDEFQKLKFLKLNSLNLEQWNSSHDHFPVLERLVLRSCPNLEMIPLEFSSISTLQNIEVFYCGKNVESSALQIREEQQDYGNEDFDLKIFNRDRFRG